MNADREQLLDDKYAFEEAMAARIAANLRARRQRDGLTIGALAKRTGIQYHTIHNWEMGCAVPSVPKLFWLCRAAGWRVSEIVGEGNDGADAGGGG